jgi:hypothetical protein
MAAYGMPTPMTTIAEIRGYSKCCVDSGLAAEKMMHALMFALAVCTSAFRCGGSCSNRRASGI